MDVNNKNQGLNTPEKIYTNTSVTKSELALARGYVRATLIKRVSELHLLDQYRDHTGSVITDNQFKKMRILPASLANFIYNNV